MRILMCCADWGVPLGGSAGSSVHLRAMAKALTRLGHEVRLVVSNPDGPTPPSQPTRHVPARRLWPALHGAIERLRGLWPAGHGCGPRKSAAQDSPGATSDEDRTPPDASWKTRFYYQGLPREVDRAEELLLHPVRFGRAVRRMMSDFRPHALYERYALCQAGASWAARRAGVPLMLEVNASLVRERQAQSGLPAPWAWWSASREAGLWRAADRVFCVSEALGRQVAAAGARPERIKVMPNGVDVEAFSPAQPRGTLRQRLGSGDDILIGWLGSLSPGRGAQEFLHILSGTLPRIPDARGVVIGGGPLEEDCRRLAAALGLDGRVSFTGPVDHDLVPRFLVDLDMAVVCYPTKGEWYFSPMKLAEYQACGLAVVSVPTPGGIRHGIDGLLVAPEDMQAWALALEDLARHAGLREALGREARRRALAGPTWDGNARMVEREIVACRAARPGENRR